MGLLIFWFGLFLVLIGAKGLVFFVWSKLNSFSKFGQVVGFSEAEKGLYKVVLRFKAFDNHEYFLVDHKASSAPAYVMGEFIPILVSTRDHKKVLMSPSISFRQSLGIISVGFFSLTVHRVFFSFSVLGLLLSLALLYGVSIYLRKEKKINVLKLIFSKINIFDQPDRPQVLDIENSKLIDWSENYIGRLAPDLKKPFSSQFLKRLKKPAYQLLAIAALYLAVSSYKNVLSHTQGAQGFQGRFDGMVLADVFFGLKLKVPQIRFYDANQRIVRFLDKDNPYGSDLKTGQIVTILVSKSDPLIMRRDLKHFNQWRAFLFGAFAFVFLLLSSQSRAQKSSEPKAPVIRIKKAG